MAVRNRRHADDGCCGLNFLRYIMWFFNVLFYLCGASLLVVGAWLIATKWHLVPLLPSDHLALCCYALVAIGAAMMPLGLFGCFGVSRSHKCFLLLFTVLTGLVLLAELAVCIVAFVQSESTSLDTITDSLQGDVQQRYSLEPAITKAITALHNTSRCCGARDFADWQHSQWSELIQSSALDGSPLVKVPEFCCRSPSKNCGKSDGPSNIFYDGCASALHVWLKRQCLVISAVTLATVLIQLFGTTVSACLYARLAEHEVASTRKRHSNGGGGYYS